VNGCGILKEADSLRRSPAAPRTRPVKPRSRWLKRLGNMCQAEPASMLPGFRFLFAAIMLSMSLLVFGLGATALLRSAHEEFASNPSWRAAPEVKFAQQTEATMPMLATIRVDLPEQKLHEDALAPAASAQPEASWAAPAQIAAVKPEQSSPEAAKPDVPLAGDNPPVSETASASPQNASPAMPAAAEEPKEEPSEEPKIAALVAGEPSSGDDRPAAARSEQSATEIAPAADEMSSDLSSTKIATLGGPPVDIQTPTKANASEAKPDQAQPDQNAAKKRAEAKRAARHRRIAATRARLAAQQAQLQLQAGPFFQPPASAARAQ
jgi:hypothetical protein